jgi:hypothetical protein
MNSDRAPVFIHSLFRSGSTYLFNAFRRSNAGYWCYQEPLHEVLMRLNDHPERLMSFDKDLMNQLRHPALSKPYFFEFFDIKEHLAGTFQESFSYETFFLPSTGPLPVGLHDYLRCLITYAKVRPVLQFCRSGGRARALKSSFDAVQIHLWRNPRDQWWSYKNQSYFDATTRLIYAARDLPPALQRVKALASMDCIPGGTVQEQIRYFCPRPLPSKENYLSFYALWLYAYLECEEVADVSINIDQLSQDANYRQSIHQSLQSVGITDLDLTDCHIPKSNYLKRELAFFETIEDQVSEIFSQTGFSAGKLEAATQALKLSSCDENPSASALIEMASRARLLALNLATNWAETRQNLDMTERRINELELVLQSRMHRAASWLMRRGAFFKRMEKSLRHFLRASHSQR